MLSLACGVLALLLALPLALLLALPLALLLDLLLALLLALPLTQLGLTRQSTLAGAPPALARAWWLGWTSASMG